MTADSRMRAQFEDWAKDYVKGMDSRGAYTSPYTMIAWQAWQAALSPKDENLEIDLPGYGLK